jgi:hypothetical protein
MRRCWPWLLLVFALGYGGAVVLGQRRLADVKAQLASAGIAVSDVPSLQRTQGISLDPRWYSVAPELPGNTPPAEKFPPDSLAGLRKSLSLLWQRTIDDENDASALLTLLEPLKGRNFREVEHHARLIGLRARCLALTGAETEALTELANLPRIAVDHADARQAVQEALHTLSWDFTKAPWSVASLAKLREINQQLPLGTQLLDLQKAWQQSTATIWPAWQFWRVFAQAKAGQGILEKMEFVHRGPPLLASLRQTLFDLQLCLESHRKSQGRYPHALAEMGALLPKVPLDVDGRPMPYIREANQGYWLWSVGEERHNFPGILPKKDPSGRRDLPVLLFAVPHIEERMYLDDAGLSPQGPVPT